MGYLQHYNDTLAHYGVLGMKWGQTRAKRQASIYSKSGLKTDKAKLDETRSSYKKKYGFDPLTGNYKQNSRASRMAYKDAKTYARAKQFYGEGAGINRRHVYKTVDQKKARVPGYKQLLDHHMKNVDMISATQWAKRKRARQDAARAVGRFGRGIKNLATRSAAPVASSALAAYTLYKRSPEFRAAVNKYGRQGLNVVKRGVGFAWQHWDMFKNANGFG